MFQQLRLFIIFLNGHLSESSVIDSKYIKMTDFYKTRLQDFYKTSSFTNTLKKQPLEVFCKIRYF